MSYNANFPNGISYHFFFLKWKDINQVEEFYKDRLETYLYTYSHEKSTEDEHLNGKMYYSGVTQDGIEITETDFLQQEVYDLNRIAEQQLTFDGRKRVNFYRELLQKKLMDFLFGQKKPLPKPEIELNEKLVNETWFKIGLTFATGRAQELYERYKHERGHFTKITLILGFEKSYRPYFSETLNNSRVDYKNLYSSPEKLKEIYTYCQIKNISVCSDFLSQLPSK